MISFKNFLIESRSTPLYHATKDARAIKILETGEMKPGGNEPGLDRSTVSLTRDLTFAKMWLTEGGSYKHGVIFVIDQRKLSHRHKIVPYSFFGSLDIEQSRKYGSKPYHPTRRTPTHSAYSKGKDYTFENQFEEAVIGEIKNFQKYVTKIYVQNEPSDKLSQLAQQLNIPIETYRA